MEIIRKLIRVKGMVQGVGFRPFVYKTAHDCNLNGSIMNTANGVEIDVEGSLASIDKFLLNLQNSAPPLAKIEDLAVSSQKPAGLSGFTILETIRQGSAETLVSFDVATCPECLSELLDPQDRRYRYPFINCTNCGPRFTIIKDMPYDRQYTTMKDFTMCPECQAEYEDPGNRRFHAQPNACPACGPQVVLKDSSGGVIDKTAPIKTACRYLSEGSILGIKGLGGYHLACNALDSKAVASLRERKNREDKPFAVMVRDIEEARRYCLVDEKAVELLTSRARPIVLLAKSASPVAEQVAPGNGFLGLMMPYTPLHYLIFEEIDYPLVMTSGNLSDEPIAYEDQEAQMRLCEIADYFLTHNRTIQHRCDDSVIRQYRGQEYPIRRSRGYAPAPLKISGGDLGQILAVGGEQKNTFCLTKGNNAFVSHHIGDLENLETLEAFEREIALYKKLFQVEPELVAYDYHPEYLSTKYALDLPGLPKTGVQHHHAHVAACMAEHGLTGNVLGVAFDGTGFGPDGSIWGGEFLYCSMAGFLRIGHLKYVPMPGGARAIREPWRMAAGYLYSLMGPDWRKRPKVGFLDSVNGMVLDGLGEVMEKWINCPLTSSMGRLFDAVAALIGIRHNVNYEGQAAVELEQAALGWSGQGNRGYEFSIENNVGLDIVNTDSVIHGILDDLQKNDNPGFIAYKFHLTVRKMVVEVSLRARERYGENRVCLSGGVFQNMLLLDLVHQSLAAQGFEVFVHRSVPTNDGGISLGQAVIAAERRKSGCV